MRRIILGTAGHIDHGKTALVRALTGVDTDRLPEEKRRGITIDLGFAALRLDEVDIGIVDVPGHEALVRNMLAGATGIDVVLLVIAADEGIMPQTREHLAIMDLLEVGAAIVAITKADLVEREWLEMVTADVCDVLSATRFADAPTVPVSSTTGAGVDALRIAIRDAAVTVTERSRSDIMRLPIDRVFTVHGTGTVVTGTVWSGVVNSDGRVWIAPGGHEARVRGLQTHGQPRHNAGAGERVALALAVDRDMLSRGDTLSGAAAWEASSIVTAQLRLLPDADRPLKHRQRVRFHLGTAEILARAALLEHPTIEPGASGWVQLRLESPCLARAGDRFVVRSYSPVHTIAGGVIAEPNAPKRKRLSTETAARLATVIGSVPDDSLLAVIDEAGSRGASIDQLPLRVPFDRASTDVALKNIIGTGAAVRAGTRIFTGDRIRHARAAVLAEVEGYHTAHPLSPGLPREALRDMETSLGGDVIAHVLTAALKAGDLTNHDGSLARAGFTPSTDSGQAQAAVEVREILRAAGLEPPAISEMPDALRHRKDLLSILRHLEKEGSAVALTRDRYIDRGAVDRLGRTLNRRFERGQEVSMADLKDAIGVSRKFFIPILEYFDREGISRRTGENRTWLGALGGDVGEVG